MHHIAEQAGQQQAGGLNRPGGEISVRRRNDDGKRHWRTWEEQRSEKWYWLCREFSRLPGPLQKELKQRLKEFDRCQRMISVPICGECGHVAAGAGTFSGTRRCQFRALCDHCRRRRERKLSTRLSATAVAVPSPPGCIWQLMTVPLAHDPSRPSELEVPAIKARIGAAIRLSPKAWKYLRSLDAVAMLRSIEHARTAGVHIHIVVLAPPIDEEKAEHALKKLDRRVGEIDVRPIDYHRDRDGLRVQDDDSDEGDTDLTGLKRVIKYVLKGESEGDEGTEAAHDEGIMYSARFELAAYRRRLVQAYGALRGAGADDDDGRDDENASPAATCRCCGQVSPNAMTTMRTAEYRAYCLARGAGMLPRRGRSATIQPSDAAEVWHCHAVDLNSWGHENSPSHVVHAALAVVGTVAASAKVGHLMGCMALHFVSAFGPYRMRRVDVLHDLERLLGCRLILLSSRFEDLIYGHESVAFLAEASNGDDHRDCDDPPAITKPKAFDSSVHTLRFGLPDDGSGSSPHDVFGKALDGAARATGDPDPARGMELMAAEILAARVARRHLWAEREPEPLPGAPPWQPSCRCDHGRPCGPDAARARLHEVRRLALPAIERAFGGHLIACTRDGDRVLYGVETIEILGRKGARDRKPKAYVCRDSAVR